MKISDAIRNWCGICRDSCIDEDDCDDLRALAERIDSEMVELPRSADGKIWTGRETCFWTDATKKGWHKLENLVCIDGRWCVEDNGRERYPAASVWFERPDSFERIACELDEWCDDVDVDGDASEKPRELADRIRKLAAKEGER